MLFFRSLRPWVWGVLGALAIMIVVYGVLWRSTAATVRSEINNFSQNTPGTDLEYASMSTGGFPFFLRVDLERPEFSSADSLRWTAPRLSVHALPYKPSHVVAKVDGEQEFAWRDSQGVAHTWRINPNTARGSLTNGNERFHVVVELAEGVAVQEKNGVIQSDVGFDNLRFSLDRGGSGRPEHVDANALLAGVAAQGLRLNALPSTTSMDDPVEIESLYAIVEFQSMNPSEYKVIDSILEEFKSGATALTLHALELDMGSLAVAARGALHVDERGYLAGELTARVNDVEGFIAFADAGDKLDAEQSSSLASMLKLIGAAQGVGGSGGVELPMQIQDGSIFVGPIAIADAPRFAVRTAAR